MADDAGTILTTLHSILSVLLTLAMIGALAAALFRFRATPSGLLMAGGFGGFFCIRILHRLVGPGTPDTGWLLSVSLGLLDFLFTLTLAVGVALIPHSLRKLEARSTAAGRSFP